MKKTAFIAFLLTVGLLAAAAPTTKKKTKPKPPPKPDPFRYAVSYKVMILGDTHFDGAEFHKAAPKAKNKQAERARNLKMWSGGSKSLLAAAGAKAKSEKVAFAVQLGDLAQGDCDNPALQTAMLRKGFAAVKSYFPEVPLLLVKGNHDIRTDLKAQDNATANRALLPLLAKELRVKSQPRFCYSRLKGRDLFIVIDGFVPAKESIAFVKKTLEDNPDTRHVFLLTHLPLIPTSPGGPFWLLPGHYQLAEMLEKRQAIVLAAHTHIPAITTRATANGRITQLVTTSMGHQWRGKIAPSKIQDWESYTALAKKNSIRGKNAAKMRRAWQSMEAKGTYTHKQIFYNSGFVVLEIQDRRIVAHIYTNASVKPSASLLLSVNQ